MKFVRIRNSQGLPKDYPLKAHHKRGYQSVVAKEFKRRIVDVNGHLHARINIKVLA